MSVGNPLAKMDTLSDGTSSYLSPELKEDFGSGVPQFTAGFIRFNPEYPIRPTEFAWIDTMGHYVQTLDADSLRIRADSTNVLDSEERYFFVRTRFIPFDYGETKSMEYAVGRASVIELPNDRIEFEAPDVVWFDGTRAGPPAE
jgi:hypothetical protein